MERVEEIREAHPETPIYLYDAGHGFVSDRRADYDADSARLARLRTLALFANNGGGRSSAWSNSTLNTVSSSLSSASCAFGFGGAAT